MNERQPIQKVPAVRGLAWISGSWELVRRQPLRLLLISLFFQFFLSFSQADAFGLLVVLCLPVLSAGMLHAFLFVERGEKPLLGVLFMPFTTRGSVIRLLLLGGVVLVLGILVVSMARAGQMMGVDPEILNKIEQGDVEALQLIDPQILESTVIAMAIAAAISGSISYFAVPLIWFKKMAGGHSILIGLRAMGRNWRPLLVIGLLLGLLAVPLILLFGSFYLSALSEGSASTILTFLLLLLGPMFQLLLFGTQFLAFKDIFGMDEFDRNEGNRSTDQLVA